MSLLDETARRAPATGEKEKAARRGLTEPARATLQGTVREAAALATDDTDLLTRLRDAGLRVREHHNATTGAVDGYAVALPGDRAEHGSRPVWFSGRTLAYDRSLPRIRERYEPAFTLAAFTRAHTRIREAAALLARAGRTQGAGDVAALGDLLAVAAAATALRPSRLPYATRSVPRPPLSSRPPGPPGARALDGTARTGFQAAARALEHAPRTARGGGAPAVLSLLLVLVEAIEAATAWHWHRAQNHPARATAAAGAAVLLREAAALTITGTRTRTTTPRPACRTSPRTVRVTPAPERGPAPLLPVTGVRPGPPPDRSRAPGPDRVRALALSVRRSPPRDHPAPAPAQLQGEPLPEALSEAAQATGMSVRLILTFAGSGRANVFLSHSTPVLVPAAIAPTPSACASAAALPAPGTGRRPGPWAAPAVSADAERSWGPLTENLSIPRDLDLRDRSRALQQLRISEAAHTYFVAQLREQLPEREAAVLVSSCQWPLLAARMCSMDGVRGIPFAPRLAPCAPPPGATARPPKQPPACSSRPATPSLHHSTSRCPPAPLQRPVPAPPPRSWMRPRRSRPPPNPPRSPTGSRPPPPPSRDAGGRRSPVSPSATGGRWRSSPPPSLR
ncbi:hypothetical protein ACIOWM_32115 [Streptomyces anulatus]